MITLTKEDAIHIISMIEYFIYEDNYRLEDLELLEKLKIIYNI